MDTEQNVDQNWSFNTNLSGLQAPTGSGGAQVPEGYYKAQVTDMYINPERNASGVIIKLQLTEAGPFKGAVRTDGLGVPKSDEDKVRYYWRGLAESAGYTPAQLDQGTLTLNRQAFLGREVHIYYVPKEEGNPAREYENITYLTPAEWASQKQAFDASQQVQQAPAGSALGGSNPLGAAPTPGGNPLGGGNALGGGNPTPPAGGNTVSQGDVLAQLGISPGNA